VQALIVRHHPSSVPLARQLFLLFDDSLMAAHAGKTLGQMPNLKGSPLNQNCHAVIRVSGWANVISGKKFATYWRLASPCAAAIQRLHPGYLGGLLIGKLWDNNNLMWRLTDLCPSVSFN